jgi:hypothetical protein
MHHKHDLSGFKSNGERTEVAFPRLTSSTAIATGVVPAGLVWHAAKTIIETSGDFQ